MLNIIAGCLSPAFREFIRPEKPCMNVFPGFRIPEGSSSCSLWSCCFLSSWSCCLLSLLSCCLLSPLCHHWCPSCTPGCRPPHPGHLISFVGLIPWPSSSHCPLRRCHCGCTCHCHRCRPPPCWSWAWPWCSLSLPSHCFELHLFPPHKQLLTVVVLGAEVLVVLISPLSSPSFVIVIPIPWLPSCPILPPCPIG